MEVICGIGFDPSSTRYARQGVYTFNAITECRNIDDHPEVRGVGLRIGPAYVFAAVLRG